MCIVLVANKIQSIYELSEDLRKDWTGNDFLSLLEISRVINKTM